MVLAALLPLSPSTVFSEGMPGRKQRNVGQAGLGLSMAEESPSADSPQGNSTSLRFKKPEWEFQYRAHEWLFRMIWMILGSRAQSFKHGDWQPNLQFLKTWHYNLNGTFWQKSSRTLYYYVDLTYTTSPFKTWMKEAFLPFLRQTEGLQVIPLCWQLNVELLLQVLCTQVAHGKVSGLKM